MPESGKKRKNPRNARRLPDIIDEKRGGLKTGSNRFFGI